MTMSRLTMSVLLLAAFIGLAGCERRPADTPTTPSTTTTPAPAPMPMPPASAASQ